MQQGPLYTLVDGLPRPGELPPLGMTPGAYGNPGPSRAASPSGAGMPAVSPPGTGSPLVGGSTESEVRRVRIRVSDKHRDSFVCLERHSPLTTSTWMIRRLL